MRTRRSTYLPITSIIIGIVILAVAVATISYRDIGRGRRQVAEMLWYQARGLLTFASVDLRSELVSRTWQPERLQTFFQGVVGSHDSVSYLALLDAEGRALVHSDAGQVGETFPTSGVDLGVRDVPLGARPPMARMMPALRSSSCAMPPHPRCQSSQNDRETRNPPRRDLRRTGWCVRTSNWASHGPGSASVGPR